MSFIFRSFCLMCFLPGGAIPCPSVFSCPSVVRLALQYSVCSLVATRLLCMQCHLVWLQTPVSPSLTSEGRGYATRLGLTKKFCSVGCRRWRLWAPPSPVLHLHRISHCVGLLAGMSFSVSTGAWHETIYCS